MLSARKSISVWLFVGAFMVFIQIIIGGITRLTDSGLSITEWEIIEGSIPPLNETQWLEAFEKYQIHAQKQYESLHANMTLSEFKKIYFWEWFHRNWARWMGFVFIFGFAFFLIKRWLKRWLLFRLLIMFLMAAGVAAMGWIMVASGLNDDTRTWVSAYKLMAHLSLTTILFGYIVYTAFLVREKAETKIKPKPKKAKSIVRWILVLTFIQIMFGGLMAGMRAGLIHPHWPFFLGNNYLMQALSETSNLSLNNFIDYEPSVAVKAIVQWLHRIMALVVTVLIGIYFWKERNNPSVYLLIAVVMQYILGVITIINCIGGIPLSWGVIHQAFAFILLSASVWAFYRSKHHLSS